MTIYDYILALHLTGTKQVIYNKNQKSKHVILIQLFKIKLLPLVDIWAMLKVIL